MGRREEGCERTGTEIFEQGCSLYQGNVGVMSSILTEFLTFLSPHLLVLCWGLFSVASRSRRGGRRG